MATDVLGLGMALAVIESGVPGKPDPAQHVRCLPFQSLVALTNVVPLVGVAAYVMFEAVPRARRTAPHRVGTRAHRRSARPRGERRGVPAAPIGVEGVPQRRGRGRRGDVRRCRLVGVILGAGVMWITGWAWVDPVIAAGIGLFILPRALRLGREALRCPVAGGAAEPRSRRRDRRPCRHRRGGGRARPPRVDPHVRHGRAHRGPDDLALDRQPRRARPCSRRCWGSGTACTTPRCRSSPTTTAGVRRTRVVMRSGFRPDCATAGDRRVRRHARRRPVERVTVIETA